MTLPLDVVAHMLDMICNCFFVIGALCKITSHLLKQMYMMGHWEKWLQLSKYVV